MRTAVQQRGSFVNPRKAAASRVPVCRKRTSQTFFTTCSPPGFNSRSGSRQHRTVTLSTRNFISGLLFAAVSSLTPLPLAAFSTGPPQSRTGAAVDGGLTCTACHKTFAPANSDPRGSVTLTVQPWRPGVTQTLKVTIKHPDQKRWGFQLTARLASDLTRQAGTFTSNSDIRVRCLAGPDAPCNGDVEFASHRSAVVTDTGAGYTYSIDWTPPATDAGDIVFYLAGNAADGNGANSNDRIYTTSAAVQPAACNLGGVPNLSSAVSSASYTGALAPNSLITIFGTGFQSAGLTRQLLPEDLAAGSVPRVLSCAAVEINHVRAPILYASATQINAVVPTGTAAGPNEVRVILNPAAASPVTSSPITVQTGAAAPALFTLDGKKAIAQFSGTSTLVADPAVVKGARAARPGDSITLWASGLGDTSAHLDAAALATSAASSVAPVTVMLAGQALLPGNVTYAGTAPGMTAGLYQINVLLPSGIPAGDTALKVVVNGVGSQDAVTILTAAQ